MAQPIVMIMISAWMLASAVGVLMSDTGLVEGLVWAAGQLRLEGAAFAAAAFLICVAVSVATGTSFGTILICGPILFPAGGLAGAAPAALAGAILAGATFGDSIAPISDTTIASALSQNADIGGTVRRRLRYVLPAGAVAFIAFALIPGGGRRRSSPWRPPRAARRGCRCSWSPR
jgi:Na+/H+ antiporter NhaC